MKSFCTDRDQTDTKRLCVAAEPGSKNQQTPAEGLAITHWLTHHLEPKRPS